jgi:hypothetical protein
LLASLSDSIASLSSAAASYTGSTANVFEHTEWLCKAITSLIISCCNEQLTTGAIEVCLKCISCRRT